MCDRRNTFASLSEDELHFLWQARRFGDLHRHFAWQVQHIRRVVLKCCVFFANRNVGLSGLRQVVSMRKFRGRRGTS